MRRPSIFSVAIGIVPFAGMCLSVSLWDRITPTVFGLPFNLFWLVLWIVLSSGCMALANLIEKSRRKDGGTTL
ncbi:DUF3311 domain-containing protein [Edaphobacter sp. HDX4]|uniref:DUF3311 domain-containing protein n=1 Tax=Edaphobacter sp. HDX4 TaxID=2794064 RepID=UPI003ABE5B2F